MRKKSLTDSFRLACGITLKENSQLNCIGELRFEQRSEQEQGPMPGGQGGSGLRVRVYRVERE